ncbi:MAG: thermonuclease family protein [Lachnospiraceae bacterium]|nr:thermonuclease family protein [Lachnospiraceae bacterium]
MKKDWRYPKRRRRRAVFVTLGILALLGILLWSLIRFGDGFGPFRKERTANGLVPVRLIAVYDGDTLLVRMPDDSEETVRMLMIDAPESVHPDETKNTEEGRKASEFLAGLLKKGQKLYLEYEDDTNNRDGYGRLLAFVWLHDSTSVEPIYIKVNMVNAIVLVNGHAQFHLYNNGNPVNETYRRILEEIR